jgi:hypothetical protein
MTYKRHASRQQAGFNGGLQHLGLLDGCIISVRAHITERTISKEYAGRGTYKYRSRAQLMWPPKGEDKQAW